MTDKLSALDLARHNISLARGFGESVDPRDVEIVAAAEAQANMDAALNQSFGEGPIAIRLAPGVK